ncbi:hypothetical protein GCM10026987_03660 [Belliella aquatica]|uniref:Uncharacterized protein n=2 Tax=Belliella aquatica TaxID=1323734 RepID=A0ABQ1M9S6_9BACT|nr:hypothetical protein GCM10010993_14600 [Belliella aquatica]
MSFVLGDLAMSYRLFADPSSYAYIETDNQLIFGLFQVLFGLVLFSFIISVLSAALVELIEKIKSGTLAYNKKGHILFVNYNIKLPMILDEFDIKSSQTKKTQNVVLLFPDSETVANFRAELDKDRWPNLDIFLRQGDLLSFHTYLRQGIFKALGLVILHSDQFKSPLESDNFNLKLLTLLVSNLKFLKHLQDRQRQKQPMKCLVELSVNPESKVIAQNLTSNESGNLFAVTTPGDVIGSVMSRAMVDIVYYKIFFETLSFAGPTIHFVDPKQIKNAGDLVGKSFQELLLSFSGASLIGFSGVENGKFHIQLCPFESKLKQGEWLIILAENIKALKFKSVQIDLSNTPIHTLKSPEEYDSRKICVIGEQWPLGNIEEFIDEKSITSLSKSHFIFENEKEYFQKEFHKTLFEEKYDNIVINLSDELGFRLSLILSQLMQNREKLQTKFITVLGDPTTEQLLNAYSSEINTVLSHKLAARYIAQLAFQKNLEGLFTELAFAEGSEFNLLEVGTHIPSEVLQNADQLKALLSQNSLIYVGMVDKEKNINLYTSNFKNAKEILVLSRGDR